MTYDLIVRNVTVLDGSGQPGYVADVGVRGEMIAAVGQLADARAVQEYDGTGKVLSPGFIDVHTHDDTNVVRAPNMLPKLSQGVTTVVVGNCGISAAIATIGEQVPDPMNLLGEKQDFVYPTVRAYQQAVDAAHPAVNVATLIGHTTLRNNHMDDLFRPATAAEVSAMREQLRQALREGAIGMSTGLAYATAFQSSTDEVMGLAEELAMQNGIYTTHLRSEFEPILDAMNEAFDIGRHAKVPVVVSHHKCAGVKNFGRTVETLALMDKVRQSQDVSCDCYPYTAGSSTLDLKQISDEIRIDITWSKPHPEMAGQTLAEIAATWGLSLLEAGKKLMPAGAIYHQMDENDVRRVLQYSATMIGSDGLPNDPMPHPRLWGAFPRVLGHYSRDVGLFTLAEAVHKMTGKSAARFGLVRRGLIHEGYFADMVLFDPATIIDKATFSNPQVPAQGVEAVFVNGVLSYAHTAPAGPRAGRFLANESGA